MMLMVSGRKAISLPRWLKALGWFAAVPMTLVGLLILSALFRSTHVVMSECREQKVVEMGCLARVRRHFRESGGISPSDNPKYTGGQT
jgi:hypothetical protein